MTRSLLNPTYLHTDRSISTKYRIAPYKRIGKSLLSIFFLITGFSLSAQEVDNWYSADRAINTPSNPSALHEFTPYAPADGTPVNIWYDLVDFVIPAFRQDAMEHPNPINYNQPWQNYPNHGFQHPGAPGFLTPIGTIPGIPTLRRSIWNFNPAVEFDGSGTGDALYFRSHARDNIAVFIVFSATGEGNTAETQSLLFGGDITNHLNSNTNLSLGVSNGNRFSIGRTWDTGTFFQAGGVDLLNRPTIGTFIRDSIATNEEALTTRVNGLVDINGLNRIDPTAGESLFYYNRMGKHFNDTDPGGGSDPSNLSGHIAEILLMDGIPNANHIQRMESYLAIKYGITLNASGTLGSINGNDSYNYLAADGTTIWVFDATYRYDIAGIGKDRFDDVGANRLRYNLHQRISKSVNTEARVTISTNSDFSTDNLDNNRTPIDAYHFAPIEHNYLVWGNDHGSMMVTAMDNPAGVDQRIQRRWKIVETRSAAADPISNVSVRVDLTGSNILPNDPCEIFLMIDEDGNGNFTDGVITLIEATTISADHVFFDNVNFNGTDVFTVAHITDAEPPTASNPTAIVVCDTVPAPDPNVVTDEDDNCAVDTVVHQGDISDNSTNPETVTRTYRVTDTSGNFLDVTQTIEVYTSPESGVPSNLDICEGDATIYDLFAQITGEDAGGTWRDVNDAFGNGANTVVGNPANMNFSTISLGSYDFTYTVTGTSPCLDATATVTVTIEPQTTPDAHEPSAQTAFQECGLTHAVDASTALGNGTWTMENGPGNLTFGTNASDPDQTLTVDAYGTYTFRWTDVNGSCSNFDEITVTFYEEPTTANAGADIQQCDNGTFNMAANAPTVGTGTWSEVGGPSGITITNAGDPMTTVTGLATGSSVTLRWTITNGTTCPDSLDEVTITNRPQPTLGVDLSTDPPACGADGTIELLFTNVPDGLYTIVHDSGSFPNVGVSSGGATVNAPAGIYNNLRITVNGCTSTDDPDVTLTDPPAPDIDPIADVAACDSFDLSGISITGTSLTSPSFYDAAGGPLGGGNPIAANAVLNSTTTIYVWDENGTCSDEESFIVTITEQPDAGTDGNLTICEGDAVTDADLFAQLGGTPDAGGNWSPAPAGAGVYTYTVAATAPCTADATAQVTVSEQPQPDTPADVASCGPYQLPPLTNGNYFTGAGGTGSALSAGDMVNASTTLHVFSPANGSCPEADNTFTVTISGFNISTTVENETCWESLDGSISVNTDTTDLPLTVQLNSMQPMVFASNSFNLDNLAAGNYQMTIIDGYGCESNTVFEVLPGGPNLEATIEPIYSCDSGLPSNSVEVTLLDSSIVNEVLYALDSTNPNDFVISPDFNNISPGNHTLSIMHNNGCLVEIPFMIEETTPLSLSLSNDYINEITANASGGFPPYTYYFEDDGGSSTNTYTITRSGTFEVTVIDGRGCEATSSITLNLVEITIPNFFTPNNDGQNDFWKPRNMELFPDIQTFIFDRYGRKLEIMGQLDNGWDGRYQSQAMPSGDYWYIVQLNDGSGREFVGHFTLYR
ncbi:T9SS type B sorting domain-containing protein [Muricauda sp. ANG21]|uniref:T9SS type B sorting domain-containing protein n=1 Tax=Allomuricauda sp. ANG21 TaxID=3042468 RepID=UPI003452FFA0